MTSEGGGDAQRSEREEALELLRERLATCEALRDKATAPRVGGAMPSTPTPPRWLEPVDRVLVALPRTGPGMRSPTVLPACPPCLSSPCPAGRSGRPRTTPLSVMELDGERYLMGGFPVADGTPDEFAQLAGTCSVFRPGPA